MLYFLNIIQINLIHKKFYTANISATKLKLAQLEKSNKKAIKIRSKK